MEALMCQINLIEHYESFLVIVVSVFMHFLDDKME